jgi:hypothetical protein
MGIPPPLEGTTKESLRAKIRQLDQQIWDAEHSTGLDRNYALNLDLEEWRDERQHAIIVVWQWVSDDLVKEAIKWGVEVPDRADWWKEHIWESPSKINPHSIEYRWLNDVGLSMISKQVKDAKLEYWKGWSQILVPILSLLVSILLAIIALLRG